MGFQAVSSAEDSRGHFGAVVITKVSMLMTMEQSKLRKSDEEQNRDRIPVVLKWQPVTRS